MKYIQLLYLQRNTFYRIEEDESKSFILQTRFKLQIKES